MRCSLDFWFPFSGHLPSYLVAGRGKNKNRSLFPTPLFSDFFEVSKASAEIGKKTWGCASGNPTLPLVSLLTSLLILRAWSRIFQSMVLHTDIIHSIWGKSPPEADTCVCVFVWCIVNHVIIFYRHILHCVWHTGLVVRDPHDVIQLFKDVPWPASAGGIDYVSVTDFLVFPSCIFIGHCVLLCPLCCFDIAAEIARLMPAITWGRFKG